LEDFRIQNACFNSGFGLKAIQNQISFLQLQSALIRQEPWPFIPFLQFTIDNNCVLPLAHSTGCATQTLIVNECQEYYAQRIALPVIFHDLPCHCLTFPVPVLFGVECKLWTFSFQFWIWRLNFFESWHMDFYECNGDNEKPQAYLWSICPAKYWNYGATWRNSFLGKHADFAKNSVDVVSVEQAE